MTSKHANLHAEQELTGKVVAVLFCIPQAGQFALSATPIKDRYSYDNASSSSAFGAARANHLPAPRSHSSYVDPLCGIMSFLTRSVWNFVQKSAALQCLTIVCL